MNIEIPTGVSSTKSIVVTRDLTIASIDSRLPAVYSTPSMIMLMETAAAQLLQRFLPPEFLSVGVRIDVHHLAATPVGATVTATATIRNREEVFVDFEVFAHDGIEPIGRGTHRRAIVELARFLKGVDRKKTAAD